MPTEHFRGALQALRVRDETFQRHWQSPVPAEGHDGLENEAYAAAHLSNIIRQHPDRDALLIKLMEQQEDRLNGILAMAEESGLSDYARSSSFHKHVTLTIDAVLRPENYSDKMQDLRHDVYDQVSIRLARKALGLNRSRADRQAIVEVAGATRDRPYAGHGRDTDDGLGWDC